MIDLIPDELLIQAVNFILTVIVLNMLLIRPIRDKIRERRMLMDDQMGAIEDFTRKAEVKLRDYDVALTEARKRGVELRNVKRDEGATVEHQLMAEAGEKAAATLKSAQAEVATQREAAMKSLAKEVGAFAQQATAKILGAK